MAEKAAADWGNMTHEIARLLLEQADSPSDRQEAVRAAIELGMPLHEIEQYLDWLDVVRGTRE